MSEKKVVKKTAKKVRKKRIETLEINRSKWLAGSNKVVSYLMSKENGKMCCLGFLAKKCGLEDREILEHGTPGDLDEKEQMDKFPSWAIEKKMDYLEWSSTEKGEIYQDSNIIGRMVEVNDDLKITHKQREAKLKRLFASVGVKLTFTGKFEEEGPSEF